MRDFRRKQNLTCKERLKELGPDQLWERPLKSDILTNIQRRYQRQQGAMTLINQEEQNRKSRKRLQLQQGKLGEVAKGKCISKEQASKGGDTTASKTGAWAVACPPEGSGTAPATFLTPNATVKILSQIK